LWLTVIEYEVDCLSVNSWQRDIGFHFQTLGVGRKATSLMATTATTATDGLHGIAKVLFPLKHSTQAYPE
jgi:hypothetical protein